MPSSVLLQIATLATTDNCPTQFGEWLQFEKLQLHSHSLDPGIIMLQLDWEVVETIQKFEFATHFATHTLEEEYVSVSITIPEQYGIACKVKLNTVQPWTEVLLHPTGHADLPASGMPDLHLEGPTSVPIPCESGTYGAVCLSLWQVVFWQCA